MLESSNKPIVIGCSGYARSGKDTFVKVASKILRENGYTTSKLAFADELKNEVQQMLDINHFNLNVKTDDTTEKNKIRPLLVWWGCARRNLGDEKYWVDKIDKQIENESWIHVNDPKHVIFISDVRFPNEATWLHEKWGGWLVHLKKYSVLKDDRKTTGEYLFAYDGAPNSEEAENDPLCYKQSDYKLELENVIEREFRLNNNIITVESLVDNSYLNEEIKLCLTKCPFLTLKENIL